MNSVTKYLVPISALFIPLGQVCAKDTDGAIKTAMKPAIKRFRAIEQVPVPEFVGSAI